MDTPESVVEMAFRVESAFAPQPTAPAGEDFTPSIT